MTTLIDETFNQKSWGDSIKAYKASKVTLGYHQEPPHHETFYAHSRDERDNKVDPIRQVFRDPQKEENLKRWEDTHHIRGLNKSFDLQLTRESQFDVVSNIHKKQGLDGVKTDTHPPQRPNLSLQSGVHYNILSNHNHEDHALPERDRETLERVYTPQQAHKRFGIAPTWVEKDYDLLSNKYHYGHEEYESKKQAGALDRAAEKFFARNDKNPVTGKFYDVDKEATVSQMEEEAKLTHGVHQMDIYPPRIKYGPGMAFDLATHTVKDGELMALLREKDEEKRRGAFRAMEKRDLEDKYVTERNADAFKKAGRGFMKISTKRYTEPVDRGYDVVTNESLTGMGGKVVFPHRLPDRTHFWDTLGPSKQEHMARMGRRADSAPSPAPSSRRSDDARSERSVRSSRRGSEQGGGGGSSRPPAAAVPATNSRSRRSSVASSARSNASSYRSGRSNRGGKQDLSLPRPAEVPKLPLAGGHSNTSARRGEDRPLGSSMTDSRLQGSWRSSRSRASSLGGSANGLGF